MPQPHGFPPRQGLYDPRRERDACGMGFIANLHGHASHEVIVKGLTILKRLTHRGATGADPDTGDGAGLLLGLPDAFLRARFEAESGVTLPKRGDYAVGVVFLAQDEAARARQRAAVEAIAQARGMTPLGWRTVPVEPEAVGPVARSGMPVIAQVALARPAQVAVGVAFERALYVVRRLIERRVWGDPEAAPSTFHIPSLSHRTMVYKGLLLAHQIEAFYPDLTDPMLTSPLALVHQRYSTNTFPTWSLAQPFRMLAHNGEINTIRGNAGWMRAREPGLTSAAFGEDIKALMPIVQSDASDSSQLDNALELLVLSGRSLAHAMAMLVPEAWEHHPTMSAERRAFYAYHANLIEPWDGPAALAFTDGEQIGAMLDRNGLRPARYLITTRGHVVLASEAGVIDLPPEDIAHKGHLQPGQTLLVDMRRGEIVDDATIKGELTARQPYQAWLDAHQVTLRDLPERAQPTLPEHALGRRQLQRLFGYTLEDLRVLLAPMVDKGKEAIGSMGDDTALACLSDRPRLLYAYFKQRFAQVTNPAIDPIREHEVMSLTMYLGGEGNLLDETPRHARAIKLTHPILTASELASIRAWDAPDIAVETLDTCFDVGRGLEGMEAALERVLGEAKRAVEAGARLLVLSDKGVSRVRAPIPALLVTAAVHHRLIALGLRTQCALIVESGEAREIGHMALLIGYGASAIQPWLALETACEIADEGVYVDASHTHASATANMLKAYRKGLLKIMAKMGLSTLQSYHGAQIFEAVGLSQSLVARFFPGTPSQISGVDLDIVTRESVLRHTRAFPEVPIAGDDLDPGGLYQWRRRGERHAFDPEVVADLQHAVRANAPTTYQAFADRINDQAKRLCTLRGLFRLRMADAPLPLDEVEPASEIVKRFCTGAMSFGSISREAHETLAVAMNRIGGRSNTGEGGEDPARFAPMSNGDSRRSAIKQVASGRFGVTQWYLLNADEIQIKIAQGAKPGEGGQLPGHKVDAVIARTRHSTPGVGLISPPPHHDIYSIEDLAQLIFDLKHANPEANVSVKLVSETGVGTVAAGVAKGKADTVVISGHDGGTGASPMTSLKYAGMPWEIGLAEAQQTLVLNHLRGRVKLQVDGGLKTGRDVVVGALLGAEEFGFSTAPLVAMGCILMRVCHLNTCPVGIATQDPTLRALFKGTPEHVIKYLFFVAEEAREWMARMGFRTMDAMIGRADRIDPTHALDHWKARALDLSPLLHVPNTDAPLRFTTPQSLDLSGALDHALIQAARPAIERGEPVEVEAEIHNTDRTVGTLLGVAVTRSRGPEGLPDDTVRVSLRGTAGQSLGAFLPTGVTLELEGDANDYVGKGLSGGKIVVSAPENAGFSPNRSTIAGNVLLYGATSGEAFFEGRVGERFCVRNSGAWAVAEGAGDHACEYMTGGRVAILGTVGRNAGAGMSGGIAYIWDGDGTLRGRCNLEMIDVEPLDDDDRATLRALIERHALRTDSTRARSLLAHWESSVTRFVRLMPVDYKRALEQARALKQAS